MSSFKTWEYKNNAYKGLVFAENMGTQLSIDETSLSHGELYTVVTNKEAKGKSGTLVAIMQGTKSENIIPLLNKIPQKLRNHVQEITLDLAGSMGLIVKKCFPNAVQVIDRFHVQQLATEALQEVRIKYRWEAIDQENQAIEDSKKKKLDFEPIVLSNGETVKQLLARSRYLLYKSKINWTQEQTQRAQLLFEKYPILSKAYDLTEELRWIFNTTKDKIYAFARLAKWNEKVEKSDLKAFNSLSRTIIVHHKNILNYFDNRSTNASAESFNAKIKAFRSQYRGVGNVNFFLYRLSKLFA